MINADSAALRERKVILMITRAISYLVYAYLVVVEIILLMGFVLLLFGALIGWLPGRLNQVADAETELSRRAEYQARLDAVAAQQAAQAAARTAPGQTDAGVVAADARRSRLAAAGHLSARRRQSTRRAMNTGMVRSVLRSYSA